jgi:lysozyme
MKISDEALTMLKHHEGVRLKPYQDVVSLWTVGVGHLMFPQQAALPNRGKGKEGYTGMFREDFQIPPEDKRTLTMAEVDGILKSDLQRFERGVHIQCPGDLTQGMYDALTSFAFNLGLGGLQRSTLRQKVNRGDKEGAAEEFLKYTKAGGKVYPGLVKRRNDERAMFLS